MRSMVHDTRVKRGPDFESDYKLVVSKLVLKLQKPKVTKQANSLRRDVWGYPKALGEYRASITAKFLQRSSDTVEDNWSEFRKAVMDSAKEHLVVPRRAKNSWILEQIDKKRDAHIHWMQSQDEQETRAKYTELQRIVKNCCKKGQAGIARSGNKKFGN